MNKRILLYILIFALIIFGIIFYNQKEEKNDKKTIVFWTLQLGTFDKYINNIICNFENHSLFLANLILI